MTVEQFDSVKVVAGHLGITFREYPNYNGRTILDQTTLGITVDSATDADQLKRYLPFNLKTDYMGKGYILY
jgi:hypothetical protein